MTGIATRRHFLQVTLAALAPLALAACGGTAAATTSAGSAPAVTSTASGSTTAAAPAVSGSATTGAATTPGSTTSAAAATASTASSAAAVAKAPAANLPVLYLGSNMINHDPAQGTAPDKLKQVTQFIADRTNANLVAYIPPTDGTTATTKLNLLLSGGQPLDIFQGNWDQYQQVALPITKLLDTAGGSIRSRFSADLWAKMTDGSGKIWGIPRLALQTKAQPVWFRTDWLKELNLAMPATFADLETTLTAFQKRNANATLATSSITDFRFSTVGGFTEFGYSNWLDKSDNKLKPAELQPGYQDWVATMAAWYKKG